MDITQSFDPHYLHGVMYIPLNVIGRKDVDVNKVGTALRDFITEFLCGLTSRITYGDGLDKMAFIRGMQRVVAHNLHANDPLLNKGQNGIFIEFVADAQQIKYHFNIHASFHELTGTYCILKRPPKKHKGDITKDTTLPVELRASGVPLEVLSSDSLNISGRSRKVVLLYELSGKSVAELRLEELKTDVYDMLRSIPVVVAGQTGVAESERNKDYKGASKALNSLLAVYQPLIDTCSDKIEYHPGTVLGGVRELGSMIRDLADAYELAKDTPRQIDEVRSYFSMILQEGGDNQSMNSSLSALSPQLKEVSGVKRPIKDLKMQIEGQYRALCEMASLPYQTLFKQHGVEVKGNTVQGDGFVFQLAQDDSPEEHPLN
jgi:hypothetical protein